MKTFPRATLLIADSPFGMNKDSWDGQAPSKGAVSQFGYTCVRALHTSH
jgi:hypothetical protein